MSLIVYKGSAMRMMLFSALVFLGSAPAAAQPTLSAADLTAIVEKVRQFKPHDQFDAPPAQQSLAGRRFSYTIEPRPIGLMKNCEAYPEWVYLQAQSRLNFSWSSSLALTYALLGHNGPVFPPTMTKPRNAELTFRSFTCAKTIEPSYTANNAFGAQFTIEKMTDVVSAIADFEPPGGRLAPSSWEANVSGDAARTMTANARIRVSGTLADWWPGTSVVCGRKRLEPSIRLPVDRTTDLCLIRGHVERIEVIDQQTGATLYSVDPETRR
jgi:hypothetical protein